jgi:hypothetical protein
VRFGFRRMQKRPSGKKMPRLFHCALTCEVARRDFDGDNRGGVTRVEEVIRAAVRPAPPDAEVSAKYARNFPFHREPIGHRAVLLAGHGHQDLFLGKRLNSGRRHEVHERGRDQPPGIGFLFCLGEEPVEIPWSGTEPLGGCRKRDQ